MESRVNWRWYLLVTAIAAALAWPMYRFHHATRIPISADALALVESAEELYVNGALEHTHFGVDPLDNDLTPLRLWPLGFPVLLYLLRCMGLDIVQAGMWINVVCWALLPPAILFCLTPLGLKRFALPFGLLLLFSPGAFRHCATPLTDLPFLLLALLSLGCLFRNNIVRQHGVGWLIASGLLAGLAYTIRNAGLALLLAVPVGIVVAHWTSARTWRRTFGDALAWGLAASPGVLAVKARGWLVFGRFEAYEMAPSDIGVVENIRWMLYSLIHDLTGSQELAALAWNRIGAILIVLPLCLAYGWIVIRGALAYWKSDQRVALFPAFVLALYSVLGCAMNIAARSLYQWGDLITYRNAMQYTWIIPTLLLWALNAPGKPFPRGSLRWATVATLGFFSLAYGAHTVRQLMREPDVRVAISNDPQVRIDLNRISDDAMVLSNDKMVVSYVSGLHVRQVGDINVPAEAEEIRQIVAEVAHRMTHRRSLFLAITNLGYSPDVWNEFAAVQWPLNGKIVSHSDMLMIVEFPMDPAAME